MKSATKLYHKDVQQAQDKGINTGGNNYIGVEMAFNSLIREFFKGSDTDELIQLMSAHIKMHKMQEVKPRIPEREFSWIKLCSCRSTFLSILSCQNEWQKKAVINAKYRNEECFKWAVIAALHHKKIGYYPEKSASYSIMKIHSVEWDWFSISNMKTCKLQKKCPGTTVSLLHNGKKSTYTARRSKVNRKCSKQANLFMIADGENRHYTAINNFPGLLKTLNITHITNKGACKFCMNSFAFLRKRQTR